MGRPSLKTKKRRKASDDPAPRPSPYNPEDTHAPSPEASYASVTSSAISSASTSKGNYVQPRLPGSAHSSLTDLGSLSQFDIHGTGSIDPENKNTAKPPEEEIGSAPSTSKCAALPPSADTYVKLSLCDKDGDQVDLQKLPPTASGGFCELYMAIHRPTNLKLAMKRPKLLFPTDDVLRRFRREAEMWSGFEHINILPFFGTMEIDHSLYLVSPWMSLGDLLTLVQNRAQYIREGKLAEGFSDESVPPIYSSFKEAKTVREIAAGVEYLHSLDVVHGDIKAKNVLLDSEGCAKICDFGLTKTVYHDVTSTDLKGVGSLRWQAPELLQNVPKSSKSDVYAFALTISEILTGDYPFPHLREQSAVITAIILRDERPAFIPVSQLGVDFDPLWCLAAACWKKEPEDRPSMQEVLKQLDMGWGWLKLPLSTQDSYLVDLHDDSPVARGDSSDIFIGIYRPRELMLAMKLSRTDQGLKRFKEEADLWATFNHDNILPFWGTMEIVGHWYFVSLWMGLGDVLTFVENRLGYIKQRSLKSPSLHSFYSTFTETNTICEIAAGLEYLHSIGIVHGNVKARNVLLDDNGTAKICGFGRAWDPSNPVTEPEVNRPDPWGGFGPPPNVNSSSPKSDVFAFSMTIVEILTGKHPGVLEPTPVPKGPGNAGPLNAQPGLFGAFGKAPVPVFGVGGPRRGARPAFRPGSRLGVDFKPLWKLAARCWQDDPEERPLMKVVLDDLKAIKLG